MAHEYLVPESVYETLRGNPVEDLYSQVVISEGIRQVHIAGTVPLNQNDEVVAKGDMAGQVAKVMENIGNSLAAADAEPSDVVRIREYVTDMDAYLEEGSEILTDFFEDEKPASTLLGVERLANPDYLIEVDCTAVVGE